MSKKMLLLDRGNDVIGLAHEIMFYGYSDMHITSDPYAVYSIAQTYRPDLILLDLAFAKDSFDFMWEHFRSSSELKNVPIVIVSGSYNKILYTDTSHTDQTYIKPADNTDFASTVGYLMAS